MSISPLQYVVWVHGLVAKTDGYHAEGPRLGYDSGRWKFQYITRMIFTVSDLFAQISWLPWSIRPTLKNSI